ncbi:hypothetical protein C7M84_013172 [Penaeus vannamei]|uniref:Uncharacterized protein n=1 Tax=Penaeus vannamei TaxID=6689 RepID=A0A3R7LZD0_PENVA|nr:hypothetical protein C7M84_013172 [Penaeus vannamei]
MRGKRSESLLDQTGFSSRSWGNTRPWGRSSEPLRLTEDGPSAIYRRGQCRRGSVPVVKLRDSGLVFRILRQTQRPHTPSHSTLFSLPGFDDASSSMGGTACCRDGRCCGCCSLRAGALAIAILNLLVSIVGVVLVIYFSSRGGSVQWVRLAIHVIQLIFNCLLIHGIRKVGLREGKKSENMDE